MMYNNIEGTLSQLNPLAIQLIAIMRHNYLLENLILNNRVFCILDPSMGSLVKYLYALTSLRLSINP